MNGFTAFSVKPLRIGALLGAIISAFGFVSAIVIVVNRLINPDMAIGWASTIVTILVIGGLLLLMLGLTGEYIGRSYISLNSSPQYVIRQTVNCELDEGTNND